MVFPLLHPSLHLSWRLHFSRQHHHHRRRHHHHHVTPRLFGVFCAYVLLSCVDVVTSTELDVVTCGSVLKLQNVKFNVRLHSHDVKYGSGSGQQSVTGVENVDDHNSYWQIKGKNGNSCTRGESVKCGSTIRLMHVNTRRNLHSHAYSSHLSNGQEVSAYGEDHVGDHGDDWAITCSTGNWRRDGEVRFKHVQTEVYLTISGHMYGRPIHGQLEVKGDGAAGYNTLWKAAEGVFVKPSEAKPASTTRAYEHDEF